MILFVTQRYFKNASAFEANFYSERAKACALKSGSTALISAVDEARGKAWQYNGGYWQYRPSPIT